MSLYGALYAGVAGLTAQSNALGIISDNIANVNTVGYKSGSAEFQTLVTSANDTTAYSPGGVLGSNQQLVSTQGLLTTTNSPTDIAVSGNGFFVVNSKADQSGQVSYTRAGSFTQDAQGDFINTAGLFLQAWPLDRSGQLPGTPGNLDTTSAANLSSLQTVNVENLTGTASPTTTVSLGANLNSAQTAFSGAGVTAAMDKLDTVNSGITASNLIVPTAIDSIQRGDSFNVTTGTLLSYNYTYGGFTAGRDITTGTGGDAGTTLISSPTTLGATPFATTNLSNTVTVTQSTTGLAAGDVVSFSGITAAVDGIPASEMNSSFVIQSIVDGTHFTIDTPTTAATSTGSDGVGTIVSTTRPFAGNILDAINPSQPLLGVTGTAPFSPAALSFTITTTASGTSTFTYTPTAPNAQLGQFNTLNSLATAINAVSGLTARVATVGASISLYVGATDADAAVTFANSQSGGVSGPPVLSGIDWVNELGLANVSSGLNRFDTLQSLSSIVNLSSGLQANVTNPLGASTLTMDVINPLDTVTFADAAGNHGSLLSALGLTTSLNSAAFTAQSTGALGPSYDPTDSAKNMASGAIPPQFSRPVSVFDALGTSHNLDVAFLKTSNNVWAVEIYAQPASDINTALPNGQIATGIITFNGDGSLESVSPALTAPLLINWTNDASASTLTYSWGTAGRPFGSTGTGTIGKTDGLSQFDSGFNVNFANQNGAPVGQLTGISIDSSGFISASYNNGETQKLYKIPLASFTDPDNLQSLSGNSYTQTTGSGVVNLKQPGDSGVGNITSGALEASNVELASQLTDMIVAQRAYQANTKVIQTADSLLQDLDQIIQ